MKAIIVAGAAIAALMAGASSATAGSDGMYDWEFGGYFPTYEDCKAEKSKEANTFRCYPPNQINAWALWNGYYT